MNFVRVFGPEAFNGGEPKYSVILSFDKDDEALVAKIEAAINECVEKTKTSKYGGKSECDELGLRVEETGLYLPAGSAMRWSAI